MLDSIIFCSTLAAGWFIVLSTPQPYCLCLSPTSTFVNWALPANKLRIMCCFFITNMLEEHRPIKGGIFCVEWWGRHWCREMGVGWGGTMGMSSPCWSCGFISMCGEALHQVYWLIMLSIPPQYLKAISNVAVKLEFGLNIILIFLCKHCIYTQISIVPEEGLNRDFYCTGSYECV